MVALYGFFARQLLVFYGLLLPLSVLVGVAAERLGAPIEVIAPCYFGIPFFSAITTILAFPGQVSWLRTLPFERRKFLPLALGVTVSSALLACVTCALALALLFRVTSHWDLAQAWLSELREWFFQLRLPHPTLTQSALSLSVANVVVALSIAIGDPARMRTLAQTRPRQKLSKRDRSRVAILPALLILIIVLRSRLDFGLLYFIAVGLAVCVGIPTTTAATLGVPRRETRIWQAVGAAVLLIETFTLSRRAATELGSGTAEQAAASVRFLGVLSGRTSPDRLADLLSDDIAPDEIRSLGALLLHEVNDGHPLDPSRADLFVFEDAIRRKSDIERLSAVTALFDLAFLTPPQIAALFSRVDAVRVDEDLLAFTYAFVDHPLTTAEVTSLLGADGRTANAFALAYIRLHPSAAWVPVVRARLLTLPEVLKSWGLLTLSVLTTHHWGWNDWHELVTSSRPLAAPVPDCARVSRERLPEASEGELNFCLRARAAPLGEAFQQRIDLAGWIALPLKGRQKSLVRQFLSARR
jgi:hypothetical protein